MSEERRNPTLTHEQIEELACLLFDKFCEKAAEKTAERAVEMMRDQFYQEAGKTFIKTVLYASGVIGTGVLYWLNKQGVIHLG